MRVATMISLGASALLGVGALFVARTWLPAGGEAAGAAPAVAADRSVVVAAMPLPYGTKLEAKHLTVAKAPASAVPEGAFTTVAQVLAHDKGAPVVLAPLNLREPVLATRLSGPGARASVAAMIGPGMRAYTIRVSDVAGVGGHVLPGDRVDVLLTRDVNADDQIVQLVSDVVIQNVRALGVNLNADPTSTKTDAKPETATLEVSVEEAQKLSVAADLGALSLALRRSGAAELAAIQPIAGRDLGAIGATIPALNRQAFTAAPPPPPAPPAVRAQPAPAPRQARPPRAPVIAARPSASVVVVHGEEVAEIFVASEWGGGA
jgi:pilus assembly protein CpaB